MMITNRTKPARPFTEYNLFFKLEREYILQVTLGVRPKLDPSETFDPSEALDSGIYHTPPLPSRYSSLVLPKDWYIPGNEKVRKRRHCKSHGKIGFHQLSLMVAEAWKTVDPEIRMYCAVVCKIGFFQYKSAIKEYKQVHTAIVAKEFSADGAISSKDESDESISNIFDDSTDDNTLSSCDKSRRSSPAPVTVADEDDTSSMLESNRQLPISVSESSLSTVEDGYRGHFCELIDGSYDVNVNKLAYGYAGRQFTADQNQWNHCDVSTNLTSTHHQNGQTHNTERSENDYYTNSYDISGRFDGYFCMPISEVLNQYSDNDMTTFCREKGVHGTSVDIKKNSRDRILTNHDSTSTRKRQKFFFPTDVNCSSSPIEDQICDDVNHSLSNNIFCTFINQNQPIHGDLMSSNSSTGHDNVKGRSRSSMSNDSIRMRELLMQHDLLFSQQAEKYLKEERKQQHQVMLYLATHTM